MKYLSWMRIRVGRLLVIVFAFIIFCILLDIGGLRFIPQTHESSAVLVSFWLLFGFSTLVALMSLTVGSLVWLFARDRRVALLLFCTSFAMMTTFVVESGSVDNKNVISILSNVSAPLMLGLLAIFLLLFPRDYLTQSLSRENRRIQPVRYYLLLAYLIAIGLLCILAILGIILHYLNSSSTEFIYNFFYNFVFNVYYLLVLVGIIATIIIAYRGLPTLRERQQIGLLVGGIVLTFAPLLLLTILPSLLGLPPRYALNGQFSSLTAIFLPLVLGYSILRYQILVFDMYISRIVAWVVSALSLVVVGYLVVMFSSLPKWSNETVHIATVAGILVVLAPCTWWLAHLLTERLYFNEILHYRRLIEKPAMLARETFDIDEAARLLTLAIVTTFEIVGVCLYVLDQSSGHYQLAPEVDADNKPNDASQKLMRQLFQASGTKDDGRSIRAVSFSEMNLLDAELQLVLNIADARRPLLLSEAARGDLPTGLARYLSTAASIENDPLVVPVRAQGKMIGLLVLGERGDGQQYAGPDFEVIDILLSRFAPVLETARLYRQANQHAMALNAFFSGSVALEKVYQSIEEVADSYASVAAEAIKGGAEVWLYAEKEHTLKRILHIGDGPLLVDGEQLVSRSAEDWRPWYYSGSNSRFLQEPLEDIPACLPQRPCSPFAWLPLIKGEQHFGMLALTYARPHLFLEEDKRILMIFANYCAAVIENTQITLALSEAYEQQKELDKLKDQFIMTASHELRTPLTAVQGYIELLQSYNDRLKTEERAEFIAKAQRGCDELVLMVGNIMDSSRMEVDINEVSLGPVALAASVAHVLEIMEGVTRRENRFVECTIPDDFVVTADELRLRQVILNIVGNAIKYSPPGSPIEISASLDGEMTTLRIRDYGAGITPEDQKKLFERFVRLERDMNSPVRGVGLGLSITRQLVEAMGGHIWIESSGEEGKGSVFAFSLKQYQMSVRALAS